MRESVLHRANHLTRTAVLAQRRINTPQRQFHNKRSPLAGLALHLHCSAMCPYNPGHKAQSQPKPLFRRRLLTRSAHAIETIENVRQMFRGNSLPRILHSNFRDIILPIDHHPHFPTRPRKLDRVRQQVRKHTFNLHPIEFARAMRHIPNEPQRDLRAFRRYLELIDNVLRHFREIQLLLLQNHLPGLGL